MCDYSMTPGITGAFYYYDVASMLRFDSLLVYIDSSSKLQSKQVLALDIDG